MILYALKSALVLMLLYTCFFALTSRETFHRLNRVLLVGSLVLALVVPLIQFTFESKPEAVNTLPMVINHEVTHTVSNLRETVVATPSVQTSFAWVFWLYLAGFSAVVLSTLLQFVALLRYLRGGLRHTDEFGNTVILHSGHVSPFSVFRFIVMSVEDYENGAQRERSLPLTGGDGGGLILRHEQAHIRLGHTYDLLLLTVVKAVQWFSPFVWLLDRDLKAVHEFEADEAVINLGIDAKQYQQLLVTKAVGNRLQPFANNLRRGSLKKRIVMMYRKKSSRPTMLKALFVVPVTALALCAFATPEVQSAVEAIKPPLQLPPLGGESDAATGNSLASVEEVEDVLAPVMTMNDSITDAVPERALFIVDGQVQSEEDWRKIDPSTIDNVTVLKSESAAKVAKDHGLNPADYKGAVIVYTKGHTADRHRNEGEIKVRAVKDNVIVAGYATGAPNTADDDIVATPEVAPQYPGGEAAMMAQIASTIRYPEYAHSQDIAGKVILKFVVEKDGSIGPIRVQKSLEERCDAEAILAVSKLGKFTPAQHQGKPVRSYCTIPVTFRLN